MFDRIEQLNIELAAERKTVIAVLEILRATKRGAAKSLRQAFLAAVREHFDADLYRCRLCAEWLPKADMVADAQLKDGIRLTCKVCLAVDRNEQYWNHPDHHREIRRQSYRRVTARKKTNEELRQTRGERIKAGLAARKERMAQ
jgi:hypothetical protein